MKYQCIDLKNSNGFILIENVYLKKEEIVHIAGVEIEVTNGITRRQISSLARSNIPSAFSRNCLASTARNRFPARRVEEHYVEPNPAGSGCRHSDASRWSNIISGKQFPRRVILSLPRIRRYIKITRHRAGSEILLAFLVPFPSSHDKGGHDREQNPSRIKSVSPN